MRTLLQHPDAHLGKADPRREQAGVAEPHQRAAPEERDTTPDEHRVDEAEACQDAKQDEIALPSVVEAAEAALHLAVIGCALLQPQTRACAQGA